MVEDITKIIESGILGTEIVENVTQIGTTALQYAKFLGLLIFGALLLGSLGRFLFGKKAQITMAVTSAMEILCVYVVHIVIGALGLHAEVFLSPLPFVSIVGEYVAIYNITSISFPIVCEQIVRMLMIAFAVNILNNLIPKGKSMFVWWLLRFLTVVLSVVVLYGVDILLMRYLPVSIMTYAPAILLAVLVLLILLGSLKLLVGSALAFWNPLFAALYTFFFANVVGRALSRALVTTAILTALILALNMLEIAVIHVTAATLIACIPLLFIVLALWYVVGHLFEKD